MSCWPYYLAWLIVAQLLQYPWLALGMLLVFVFQSQLPDPWVWLRTSGRIRSLRAQVDANAANVTARRDLARLYLERGRPGPALPLLAQARERAPQQAELLLLTGTAQLRAGQAEAAIEPLVQAVAIDPRIGFGEPYRLVGDALCRLGRFDDAEEAYQRLLDHNSSSLEALFRLHQVRKRAGRTEDAKAALDELFATWHQLPGFHRRQQWTWWLRALPARLSA